MEKNWAVADKISEETINQFPEINPVILQLLFNRGITTQEGIDEFTKPDYGDDMHDPFLFHDMQKAVGRIMAAIEKKEKITVHGDYDADGVSATVVMVSVLRELGAEVEVYIPHRMSEGYGLNPKTIDELVGNGTKLVITVDCGISNKEEVAQAHEKGMDIIVTDHHEEPPELPEAVAIINPSLKKETYPFKKLAGSGVAYKLAQGLVKHDDGKKIKEGFEKWLLDVVALGTIADMVPLVGENRTLARYGLIVLRKTRRPGLLALAEVTRLNLASLDSGSVAFGIIPRLNAAGRIDHANTAFELLMCDNQAEAQSVAESLEHNNKKRQRITEQMVSASKQQIGEPGDDKILFAFGDDWSPGVVGLVAGRVMDVYDRPVLVMGNRDGQVMGSGRSIPAFDITAALVKSREYLDQYGGHAAACGFTIKEGKLEDFKQRMKDLAQEKITEKDMVKRLAIDSEVQLADINWELVNQLEDFEPFGQGNPTARFVSYGMTVKDMQKVGNEGKHLRLQVEHEGNTKKIIAFGFGKTWGEELQIGDAVDAVYEISINEWNGNRELQLKLVDIRRAKE